jgi:hypothetical protein
MSAHLERGGFEGRLADEESVHDTAEGPHVGREAVTLLVQYLGGDVVRGPADSPVTRGGRHQEPCCWMGQCGGKNTDPNTSVADPDQCISGSLLDTEPELLGRGTDPDPSLFKQK